MLPFDPIANIQYHNQQMELIGQVLPMVGGGLPLCIQAVLQACDHGEIEVGEKVIVASGDFAVIVTASNTKLFLTKESGMIVNEILCKPRNLTTVRKLDPPAKATSTELFKEPATIELRKSDKACTSGLQNLQGVIQRRYKRSTELLSLACCGRLVRHIPQTLQLRVF